MYLSEKQYQQTLPRQRGNVGIENRVLLDGLIFRCKTGCAWRGIAGQMAHHLHPPKPMGKKRGSGTGVYRPGRGGA